MHAEEKPTALGREAATQKLEEPANAEPNLQEKKLEKSGEPLPQPQQQWVVFSLADENYGVEIGSVTQIIELQPITAVPGTAAYVEGLTNLRGTVLPVIDLRRRFGIEARAPTPETRIIVAQIRSLKVGMIVDAVREVLSVPETAIEPPAPLVTAIDSAYIAKIAKVERGLIALLDLHQVWE